MKLTEITREDVIENCEKYYNNKQEFFLKIKGRKDLLSVYIERYEEETEDDYHYCFEHYYVYYFEYYCDDEDGEEKDYIGLDEGFIQHIYIMQ